MPTNCDGVVKRSSLFKWLGALCFSALAVPLCFGQDAERRPATPAGVLDVVVIQPFKLNAGYAYGWLESHPVVSDGLLVVLRVDARYVVPRNTGEPVLFAGDRTVQRLNHGNGSGYVIGIIPGALDLAAEPVWFGQPQLPERVSAKVIEAERALADSAGIKPFGAEKIKLALLDAVEAEDLAALLRGPAADLVLKFSPDEKHLAETWRLPTAGSTLPK